MGVFKKSTGAGSGTGKGKKAPRTDAELRAATELFVPGNPEEKAFVERMNAMGRMPQGPASSSSDRIPHPDADACARGHDVTSVSSGGRTVLSCRRQGCGYTESHRT